MHRFRLLIRGQLAELTERRTDTPENPSNFLTLTVDISYLWKLIQKKSPSCIIQWKKKKKINVKITIYNYVRIFLFFKYTFIQFASSNF